MRALSYSGTVLWLLAAALVAGCGGPTLYDVKGQIVRNGQPLPAGPKTILEVVLHPLEPNAEDGGMTSFPAEVESYTEGTFLVRQIPAGQYKVSLRQYDPFGPDKLKEAYLESNTPLRVEIRGPEPIKVDLAQSG